MLGVTAFDHRKRGKINNADNMVVAMNIFQLFNTIPCHGHVYSLFNENIHSSRVFQQEYIESRQTSFQIDSFRNTNLCQIISSKSLSNQNGKKIVCRCLRANGAAISMNSLMYLPDVACSYDVGLCHFHLHFLANITNISQY